ncbi:MAG: GyrI-like domain-containing protein [Ignavibacteriaceae bacterium]|nr:GyrI-like domain-containing protein [Ignavibacteriaceae bacterium]
MPNAEIINITDPIYCICKIFTGAYTLTDSCISLVREYLDGAGISHNPGTGVCILLDNPLGKTGEELRSICGVVVPAKFEVPEPYFLMELSGKYLRTRSQGPLPEIRLPAYQSLLNYIIDEQVVTENGEKIEITRMSEGKSVYEIYLRVKE